MSQRKRQKFVYLIGVFLQFSLFFLTVRICGFCYGFRFQVVIMWIKFDFVLLLLLIYVDLTVKLGSIWIGIRFFSCFLYLIASVA
jgi:hypothetical protein